MQRFIGIVKRKSTARHVARIGNEKRKNIIVLKNLKERHSLRKPELERTEDKRV
jgi:hypothetical protein